MPIPSRHPDPASPAPPPLEGPHTTAAVGRPAGSARPEDQRGRHRLVLPRRRAGVGSVRRCSGRCPWPPPCNSGSCGLPPGWRALCRRRARHPGNKSGGLGRGGTRSCGRGAGVGAGLQVEAAAVASREGRRRRHAVEKANLRLCHGPRRGPGAVDPQRASGSRTTRSPGRDLRHGGSGARQWSIDPMAPAT